MNYTGKEWEKKNNILFGKAIQGYEVPFIIHGKPFQRPDNMALFFTIGLFWRRKKTWQFYHNDFIEELEMVR